MRYFNTAGPVVAADHYGIPPLQRLDLAEVLALIRQKKYFVLHAPRQSGKTSALLALRDLLNGGAEGAFRCVYCNVEGAGALAAREQLIRRRETHLDQLADKLQEERVRRVVEPLLSGGGGRARAHDLEYVRDLGLVAPDPPVRVANPIYAEVVPRELTWITQEELTEEAAWYVDAAGGLQVNALMTKFQQFFREHSEHWRQRFQYQEAWPQLLLQAFLQRIVNGGGRIDREYGLGRGRTDLLLEWPRGGADGGAARYVVECKVRRGDLQRTIAEGVAQTAGYLDRCGAQAGHLVIFDRDDGRSWDQKVFHDQRQAPGGVRIEIWGM